MLYTIAQVAAPLLSCVTWALLRLLVFSHCVLSLLLWLVLILSGSSIICSHRWNETVDTKLVVHLLLECRHYNIKTEVLFRYIFQMVIRYGHHPQYFCVYQGIDFCSRIWPTLYSCIIAFGWATAAAFYWAVPLFIPLFIFGFVRSVWWQNMSSTIL